MRRDSPVLNALNLDERRVIEGTIIAIPKDASVEDKLTEESTDESNTDRRRDEIRTRVKFVRREYPAEKEIDILKTLSNKKEILTDDESKALGMILIIMDIDKNRFKLLEQFREKHGVYESE